MLLTKAFPITGTSLACSISEYGRIYSMWINLPSTWGLRAMLSKEAKKKLVGVPVCKSSKPGGP